MDDLVHSWPSGLHWSRIAIGGSAVSQFRAVRERAARERAVAAARRWPSGPRDQGLCRSSGPVRQTEERREGARTGAPATCAAARAVGRDPNQLAPADASCILGIPPPECRQIHTNSLLHPSTNNEIDREQRRPLLRQKGAAVDVRATMDRFMGTSADISEAA